MTRALMHSDGENRAVRSFLMYYSNGGITVERMKENLRMAGFPYWPTWVDDPQEYQTHLTKAGAQIWLRYLFNLEKF